jgi:hypothetical protein
LRALLEAIDVPDEETRMERQIQLMLREFGGTP